MIKKLLFIVALLFASNAYALNIVQLNPEYFPDPSKGKPIALGEVYVGDPDTDPEVVANQKTVSVQEEDGTITAVSQPVALGAGGVPLYNGSPVTLLTDGDYSLKLLNSAGSQVYYTPSDLHIIDETRLSGISCDLVTAISNAGSDLTEIIVDCEATLADGVTATTVSTTTLRFEKPGKIIGTSGGGTETLAINGGLIADPSQQIADITNITLGGSPKIEAAYPEWVGGVGDDSTDNQAAIEAVAAWASGTFGKVVLTSGDYVINDTVDLASDMALYINEGASIKLGTNQAAGGGTNLVRLDGLSNVGVYGPGKIDGNAANQATGKTIVLLIKNSSNVMVHDIELTGAQDDAGSFGDGVLTIDAGAGNDCTNITFSEVYAHDNGRWGLAFASVNGGVMSNNIAHDNGYGDYEVEPWAVGGVDTGEITNVQIIGNTSYSSGADNPGVSFGGWGIHIARSSDETDFEDITVIGNTIRDITGTGIGLIGVQQVVVEGNTIKTCSIHGFVAVQNSIVLDDIKFNGNIISDTGDHGIHVSANAADEAERMDISYNTIYQAGDANNEYGMSIGAIKNSKVTFNTVTQSADHGIFLNECDSIMLVGNQTYDNGVAAAGNGIYISNGNDYTIDKNVAYDGASGTQNYALQLVTVDEVIWGTDNNFSGNFLTQFQNTSGTNIHGQQEMVKFGTIAAGTDDERPIFHAGRDCEVITVSLLNAADITQNDTDYTTYGVQDKGSDGTGSTVIGSATTKITGGIDVNEFDAASIGTLTSGARLATGDVLSLDKADTASGQPSDEMLVIIEYLLY